MANCHCKEERRGNPLFVIASVAWQSRSRASPLSIATRLLRSSQ
jgi:hypothetical protein